MNLSRAVWVLSFLPFLVACPPQEDPRAEPARPTIAPVVTPSASTAPAASSVAWGPSGAAFLADTPFTMLMHADTPYQLLKGKRIDRETDVHLSLTRIRKGKLAAFAAVLFVDGKYQKEGALSYCNRAVERVDTVLREHSDLLRPALGVGDFETNWKSGHASVMRTMEGSWCLDGRIGSIDAYHAKGFRMIGLTWQDDHDFATSWTYHGPTGLTALGKKAIARLNQLGIIVDVSHMSDRAIDDVLAEAKAPVIASHSNARAVCDHPRNLTDEHIRRIAATGGVVGINFYDLHLRKAGRAKLQDVVRHIVHVRNVGGLDCVALGSDFDGISRGPEGLETAAELPNLANALRAEGFKGEEIAAIFGGNFLRALRSVEERKAPTQPER